MDMLSRLDDDVVKFKNLFLNWKTQQHDFPNDHILEPPPVRKKWNRVEIA